MTDNVKETENVIDEGAPVTEEGIANEGAHQPDDEAYNGEDTAISDVSDDTATDNAAHDNGGTDYAKIIEEDLATLKAQFPELHGIEAITQLNNPLRYAALRDLGLSPAEAYLATARRYKSDTRSHLKSAHGRNAARSVSGMSYAELTAARDLFPGKNDAEIERLYKRVSK